MRIVGQVERVADEMVAGKWPQKTAKAAVASTANPLYRDLPYLCDWKQTIEELEKGVRASNGQRLPCVVIPIATQDDC
jgi:hypothetical protein